MTPDEKVKPPIPPACVGCKHNQENAGEDWSRALCGACMTATMHYSGPTRPHPKCYKGVD